MNIFSVTFHIDARSRGIYFCPRFHSERMFCLFAGTIQYKTNKKWITLFNKMKFIDARSRGIYFCPPFHSERIFFLFAGTIQYKTNKKWITLLTKMKWHLSVKCLSTFKFSSFSKLTRIFKTSEVIFAAGVKKIISRVRLLTNSCWLSF